MRTAPLRWRIALLALPLALVPLGLVGGLAYWSVETTVAAEMHASEGRALDEVRASIHALLLQTREQAGALAVDPRVRKCLDAEVASDADRRDALRSVADIVGPNRAVRRAALIDRLGRERLAFGDEPGLRQVVTDPFFFETLVGHMCQSRVLGASPRYYTRFTHAVGLEEHRFAGEVAVEMDLTTIASVLRRGAARQAGALALFDDTGRVFASSPAVPRVPGSQLQALAAQAGAGGVTVSTRLDLDSVAFVAPIDEFIRYLEPTPGEEWFIVAVMPEGAALRRLARIRWWIFGLSILAGAIGVGGAALIARTVTGPVNALLGATDRVGHGEFDVQVSEARRDEIGRLSAAFNSMVRSLASYRAQLVRSEGFAAVGRLASAVAHEVRNPLHAIRGCADYLRLKRADDPLVTEHADIIVSEIEALNSFVGSLLHFTRLTEPERRPLDIGDLLRARAALHARDAAARTVTVQCDIPPSLPLLHADPIQLGIVLENLINNALQAMPNGGMLRLEARRDADAIEVAVGDSGCGMPADVQRQVFTPFFTTKIHGSGLGLATCRRIVEYHGGRIEFTSDADAGTRFTVRLPINADREHR